jgi:hypothetical protein
MARFYALKLNLDTVSHALPELAPACLFGNHSRPRLFELTEFGGARHKGTRQ